MTFIVKALFSCYLRDQRTELVNTPSRRHQCTTISEGQASNREEMLINIDNFYPSSGSIFYDSTAIRVGNLKLLMDVRNHTWCKPPELFPSKRK